MFTVFCIRYIQSEQFLAIANRSGEGSTSTLSWSFSSHALLGKGDLEYNQENDLGRERIKIHRGGI